MRLLGSTRLPLELSCRSEQNSSSSSSINESRLIIAVSTNHLIVSMESKGNCCLWFQSNQGQYFSCCYLVCAGHYYLRADRIGQSSCINWITYQHWTTRNMMLKRWYSPNPLLDTVFCNDGSGPIRLLRPVFYESNKRLLLPLPQPPKRYLHDNWSSGSWWSSDHQKSKFAGQQW